MFNRARENARRASCQSNLKQIGLAVAQYVQDYDDRYPLGQIYPFGGSGNFTYHDCATEYAQRLNFPVVLRSLSISTSTTTTYQTPMWMSLIYPYTKNIQVYRCPSGPNRSEATNWTNSWLGVSYWGYAYNPLVFSQWVWNASTLDSSTCTVIDPKKGATTMTASRFANVATVAMMGDRGMTSREALDCPANTPTSSRPMCSCSQAQCSANNVTGWLAGEDSLSASSTPSQGTNPSRRHFEGSNYLFLDGHVKWMTHDQFLTAKPGILNQGVS